MSPAGARGTRREQPIASQRTFGFQPWDIGRLHLCSSAEEFRWALHNLDVARQLAKCLPLTPSGKVNASAWIPAVIL